MIARGFKPVAWVAAVALPAIGCYMLSLKVAAERAELANIETRILAARQDIRTLQTELGTRGRLQQLEQWNADVLALAAPVSRQFVGSNVSLARFDTRAQEFAPAAEVQVAAAPAPRPANPVGLAPQQASLERPQPAAPAPVVPTLQRAALTQERVPAATRRPEPAAPAVRRASLATMGRPAAPARQAATPARQNATPARSERTRSLVSADTAAALRRQARTERETKRD